MARAALRHRQTRQLPRARDFVGARRSHEGPAATKESSWSEKGHINISGEGQRGPSKISA